MKNYKDTIKKSVIKYCSEIGTESLLVQGAGGNVSWKDEDTLWIKASGTWLAEAAMKDIFVPVDLHHLRSATKAGNFSVTPLLRGESALRPSIETLLHALMPHKVVIHLHAVEALAYLVRENCHNDFLSLLEPTIHWTMVDYHKPGAELAAAVSSALAENPNSNVIFLKNHGVVIGGIDIAEVKRTLNILTESLKSTPARVDSKPVPILPSALENYNQYTPVQDSDLHQLALNPDLFTRLDTEWALYPDHVVFLGERAYTDKTWRAIQANKQGNHLPELIFIQGCGVFVTATFNKAKHAQLRCYYDVITRQNPHSCVKALTVNQVAELLNWDAEKYRQFISN